MQHIVHNDKLVSYYYVTQHQKRKGENRDIRYISYSKKKERYIYIYKLNLKQNKKERCINDRTFNNLHG